MLGFFSNKTVHPLADAREAKRIIAEISASEPVRAVEDAGGWLESLAAEDGFKLSNRLDLILRLDAAAVTQARRLGRDYPALASTSRVQESRQWKTAHGFWQNLVTSYLDCIERGRAAEKEGDPIRGQLPLIYGRTINALAGQLKWMQFRYGPVEPEFWLTLGRMYLAAVEAKAAQSSLQLYAGTPETTIEAEYLKVLLFRSTSMDNLRPMEIEIAERLIVYFLPFFSLIRELRPENVYWVDAAKPLPPTRLAKLPEVTPTLRFFNGARALEAVTRTIEQIRKEERVPPGINLGGQYDVSKVIPVLEHLAMCWAPTPPMRGNARHRVSSALKVLNGLAATHERLALNVDGAESLDTWTIDDVSLGGLGVQVTVPRHDWIHIGALVGLQPDGGDNWLIGIVRRYARTGANQGLAGIEVISKTPQPVYANVGGLLAEGILLDPPEVGEYVRLILPPETIEENVHLTFDLGDKNTRLHPRETIEVGGDYVIANFFVQSFS